MTKSHEKLLGKIIPGDCLAGLKRVPDEIVHLAFADPPFNIGYDYDAYDDRLESEKYVEWCRDWLREIHRVLALDGTFWLAIGDEYAAELKLAAQSVGFHPRSWVVWYYTFGVHCKTKFTRSHAHLFYFVKNSKRFTFNTKPIAVPSARQLVYADSRANPDGRMPDDTWILRPQDCVDGFNCDEDTWYFPRVNGTFKERAGFHGCQMPEQLLGRIVRSCSNEGDLVLDPFAGSATTLVVAKKLGRRYFGFELSQSYVKLGTKRLDAVAVGDRLEGAEEPKVSAPATPLSAAGKRRKNSQTPLLGFFEQVPENWPVDSNLQGLLEAFARANHGYSVDRVVVDPILNEDFQTQCDRSSIPGTATERNRLLFRVRKAGKLKQLGLNTSRRTCISWDRIQPFIFGSEIAWARVSNDFSNLSLDDIFCDPRIARSFDDIAMKFAPGFSSLEYRWAALRLRKNVNEWMLKADSKTDKELGLRKFTKENAIPLGQLDFPSVVREPGVYALRNSNETYYYAGETNSLQGRLRFQFNEEVRNNWVDSFGGTESLELVMFSVANVDVSRLARQFKLVKRYKPAWNIVRQLTT